jgi:hypothetical protein
MRIRAVSSVGRAPALQAGGRWFEPGTAHGFVEPFLRSVGLPRATCDQSCDQYRDRLISSTVLRSTRHRIHAARTESEIGIERMSDHQLPPKIA